MKKLVFVGYELVDLYKKTSFLGVFKYCCYALVKKRSGCLKFIKLFLRTSSAARHADVVLLGAGVHAASIHAPIVMKLKHSIRAVISKGMETSVILSALYGCQNESVSYEDVLRSKKNLCLLISTPNFLHADQIYQAVQQNIYTYCEKPAAITNADLKKLRSIVTEYGASRVMIGFNRRFSPAIKLLLSQEPIYSRKHAMEISYRVNFGPRVNNSISDKEVGGGRLHGVVCHYVDLMAYIVGFRIVSVSCVALDVGGEANNWNTFTALFRFEDGSIGTLIFTSEGDRSFGTKEMIDITSDGNNFSLSDFKRVRINKKLVAISRYYDGSYHALKTFFHNSDCKMIHKSATLQDGILATEVTLAMEESIRHGGKAVSISRLA